MNSVVKAKSGALRRAKPQPPSATAPRVLTDKTRRWRRCKHGIRSFRSEDDVDKAAGHDDMIERSARLVMGCADQIYDGVHRLIAKLRPLALDRFGLRDALQDLLDDRRAHPIEVALSLATRGDLERVDDDVATAAYRIVQEALNNALRHAQASRVEVTLQESAQGLLLLVQDNGIGQVAQFESSGHYGLLGMRERAQALGGKFDLEQVEPTGVRVRVNLPIQTRSESL